MRAMARKRGRTRLSLPWEQRGAWLRELVAGRRWRAVLVGFLSIAAAAFVVQTSQHRSKVRQTRSAIAEVQRAIAAFRGEMGRCPRSMVELVHPPGPGARHLHAMPRDAWGREFYVRCPGRYDPQDAEVVSAGPSGSFFVDDNVE
jgi:type II secretory pathway pseudopilin PulG